MGQDQPFSSASAAQAAPGPDFRGQIRLARTVGLLSMVASAGLMLALTPAAKGVLHVAQLGTAHFEQIHVDTTASADGICAELQGVRGDNLALQQWLTTGRSPSDLDGTIDVEKTAPQGPETYHLSRVSVASVSHKPNASGEALETVKVKCDKIAKSR